jgi:hypothetical protein
MIGQEKSGLLMQETEISVFMSSRGQYRRVMSHFLVHNFYLGNIEQIIAIIWCLIFYFVLDI